MRCKYLVSGEEICPETGRPHLQCYVEFDSPVRRSRIQKEMGKVRCVPAKGTGKQASDYCKKGSGTVEAPKDWDYFEYGTLRNSGQGARSELHMLRDLQRIGASDREILDNDITFTAFYKYQRGITAARSAYSEPLFRDEVSITLIIGPPGTGKSSYARREFPDAYWKDNTKWWPRYHGHKRVIWDEFSGSSCTPSEYNKVFDRYPHFVEPKGGDVQLAATEFVIITNYEPETWWNPETARVCILAVTRRIGKVIVFRGENVVDENPLVFRTYDAYGLYRRTGRIEQ